VQAVGGHELLEGGHHGGALGFVALEGVDPEREPGRVGEQADGDLWFQAALEGAVGGRGDPALGQDAREWSLLVGSMIRARTRWPKASSLLRSKARAV